MDEPEWNGPDAIRYAISHHLQPRYDAMITRRTGRCGGCQGGSRRCDGEFADLDALHSRVCVWVEMRMEVGGVEDEDTSAIAERQD